MSVRARLLFIPLAAVAALGLGGCGFFSAQSGGGKAPVKRINVSTPYSATGTVQPGTIFTPAGGGSFNVSNQVVKGTFSATLPTRIDPSLPKRKKRSASAAGGGLRSVSGTFVSKLAGTYNAATGTGTFTGVKLVRFAQGKLGNACLTWNSSVTNNGNNETGSFTLAGGTKLAARARFTGTYAGTKSQVGTTATVTGTITASGKVGKPARGLTPDCQALVGQL